MKRLKLKIAMVAVVAAVAGTVTYQNQTKEVVMSELALANVEALAFGESGSFGCGRAVYEWDNDWYEDTKHFTRCMQGCPDGEGTSPKYINC